MCDSTTLVSVKIPTDLSCTGQEKWREAMIDSCIAELVLALQEGGIDMRGSCCGHGRHLGSIALQDGRELIIADGSCFRAFGLPWAIKQVLSACRQHINYWKRRPHM